MKYGLFYIYLLVAFSCSSYKQNIMFNTDGSLDQEAIDEALTKAQGNYVVNPGDLLELEVYTNDGERIIDPDLELSKVTGQGVNIKSSPKFQVDYQGIADLPMIGKVQVTGLTIIELNDFLESKYAKFYSNPFVITRFVNKRVTLLGAPGGKVIPLQNEHTRLSEVLALAGGLGEYGNASNIRILREGSVYVADFSTTEGWKQMDMIVQPNDIIYIEPTKRVLGEATREIAPLVSIITSLAAIIAVILTI